MIISNNTRSVIKANKRYYCQTFLEECKYAQGKREFENYIDDDNDDDDDLDSDFNSKKEIWY